MDAAGRADVTAPLTQEAARLICDERLIDYAAAKRKAVQRLGLGAHTALPDNASVREAVIAYQRMFGGDAYREHLRAMRQTALRAMELLKDFSPRLVGGAANGAVTSANRVQLHVFDDQAEAPELFLLNRNIVCTQGQRRYRYADGREQDIALTRFEGDGIGVDVAVFSWDAQRRAPLDPSGNSSYQRLDADAVRALLAADNG